MKARKTTISAPKRQQERTETTRRKIMESAREIFARDGVEAARLEEIASHAGYTRGAFYANFESKEELFLQVVEVQLCNFSRTAQEAVRSQTEIRAKCAMMVQALLNDCDVFRWALLLLEFRLFTLRNPKFRSRMETLDKLIKRDFENVFRDLFQATPYKPKATADVACIAFGALFQGLILQCTTFSCGENNISKEQAADIMIRFLETVLGI